jgi:GT2 family glycosyltransferase
MVTKLSKMKVSIIIPYKEDRGWLQDAITSVKNQKYRGEIELIMSKSDKSVAHNLNVGIAKATGVYIKYLCDDDILPLDSIQNSVNCIQGYDFIHGNAINFFENGREDKYIPPHKFPTIEQMINNNVMHGGSLMYRKELFALHGGFDETLTCCEEYDMNMRLIKVGIKFNYCPHFLYRYRRHDGQKSLGKHVDQTERAGRINKIKDRYR